MIAKLFRALFRREPPSLFARLMAVHVGNVTLGRR